MKRTYLICILAFFGFIAVAESQSELTITEVARDVYCVTHAYPWPANSVVARMDDGTVVVIDTPYTPGAMEEELGWIRARYGEAKIVAVNTHFHVDRLGGNAALVKRGIPVYSSELTVKAIAERGKRAAEWTANMVKDPAQKRYYENLAYTPPNRIFKSRDGLTLRFGAEEIIVKYHGVGHSVDNLFVYIPSRKVLFGGCAILNAEATGVGNVTDGSVGEWKKTIARVDAAGYTCVIPGHGKVGGIELVEHTKEILNRN